MTPKTKELIVKTIPVTRTLILIILLIALVLGYYSHFTSAWTSYKEKKPHEICYEISKQGLGKKKGKSGGIPCPPIVLEYIFLGMATTAFAGCLMVSLLFLVTPEGQPSRSRLEMADIIYHGFITSFLLLPGGIFYVVSGAELDDFYRNHAGSLPKTLPQDHPNLSKLPDDYNLRVAEKCVAGSFSILIGLVCIVMGYQYAMKYPHLFQKRNSAATPMEPETVQVNQGNVFKS